MPGPQASKAAWRAWARARRQAWPAPDSAAICAAALPLLRQLGATRVLAYHALPGEPDVTALEGQVQLYTTRAVFRPVPQLTLHRWDSATELSRFGARQPPRGTPQIDRAQVQAVLLPGLAFDRAGWRLGYGGGFYDRLLYNWPVPCIGLVGAGLWVPALPHGPHDLPVQWVVTEAGTARVGSLQDEGGAPG